MICRHCGAQDANWIDRSCPSCGRKLPGPAPGSPGAGRPTLRCAPNEARTRTLATALSRDETARVDAMLKRSPSLDASKLVRAALAFVDAQRGRRTAEAFLRDALGETFETAIRSPR